MEITLAYFVFFKFSILVLSLLAAFKLYRLNYKKPALAVIIILVLIEVFIPIHYNGTKSDTFHNTNQHQVTNKYNDVNTTPEHIDKPTFNEILHQEDDYNKIQNNKLHKELK